MGILTLPGIFTPPGIFGRDILHPSPAAAYRACAGLRLDAERMCMWWIVICTIVLGIAKCEYNSNSSKNNRATQQQKNHPAASLDNASLSDQNHHGRTYKHNNFANFSSLCSSAQPVSSHLPPTMLKLYTPKPSPKA